MNNTQQLLTEVAENEYGYVAMDATDNDKIAEAQVNGCMLEMALFQAGYHKGKILYATKLHEAEQDNKELKDQIEKYVLDGRDKEFKGRALLEKVLYLIPGTEPIHDKIQTFLDGTK